MISICLKSSDALVETESQNIAPEHFSEAHRYIFMAMLYLHGAKRIKPTPMSIMEVLGSEKAKKTIEEVGGLDYLMLLEEMNVPEDNLNIFIEKVKQSYTRRKLLDIAENVQEFVLSDKAEVLNPSELVGYAEEKLNDLAVNATTSEEVYKMGTDMMEVLEQRAETPSQVPGLEVGMPQYDRITNGARGGDLIIVCAPSKVGKSTLLSNWAKKIGVVDKLPVLYIDSEMNSREQEDRLIAMITGIPESEITSGMYVKDTVHGKAKDKIERIKKARKEIEEGQYYHIYMPHFTIEKVSALAKKFKAQLGIVALFFDYIKIPSDQGDFRTAQEYQKLGFFTSGLKDLAGTLDIPIFSACQANRSDVNNENPDEGDIGGSYRILQLASKLMFLHNKSDERIAKDGFQNGNQQLRVKFQRNGASNCDPINIMFDKPILRQTEV